MQVDPFYKILTDIFVAMRNSKKFLQVFQVSTLYKSIVVKFKSSKNPSEEVIEMLEEFVVKKSTGKN